MLPYSRTGDEHHQLGRDALGAVGDGLEDLVLVGQGHGHDGGEEEKTRHDRACLR